MAWTLNRSLLGVNYVHRSEYNDEKPRLFYEFIASLNLPPSLILTTEEIGQALKLHPREIEKLKEPGVYICEYAEDNLRDYIEAKRAVEEFMRHQHGFQNPADVADTGMRIPLEALACDLGLVEIHPASK